MNEYKFFEVWEQVCENNNNILINSWNNKYTESVLGRRNSESIINHINRILGDDWDVQQEYYSSDVIFYKKTNMLDDNPYSTVNIKSQKSPSSFNGVYLKHLDIHLEHENDIKKSWEEIIQLQNVPGDLNVLVTYPLTNNVKEIKAYCDAIENIIFNETTFKLLLIFGVMNIDKIEWQGFFFKDGKFLDINNFNKEE